MKPIRFTTAVTPDFPRLHLLLNADPKHPHIHITDMPYRLTSTWQDHDGEIGLWEDDDQLLAWAVYLPAWWNLDYAIHPTLRGTSIEKEIFAWGKTQKMVYANRTGEEFYGSVEIYKDFPQADQTIANLEALGYEKFDWTMVRFEIDLQQALPQPKLPQGFQIRPLQGMKEVEAYVDIHRAAFGSDRMTTPWRARTLTHPDYHPKLDLIAVDPQGNLAGFCVCWLWQQIGQIEPLGVHPNYQGLGLGRALELTALQTLQIHGAQVGHVDHTSFNEKAISLSLQTGFKQINQALRYYVDVKP